MLFRSYYAMRSIRSPDGIELAAVVGVCQRLVRIMRELQPRHVAVVFDVGPTTFRNALEPTYKANRGEPPDDLIPQFDLVRESTEALGFCTLGVPDFEADDIMATLARMSREVGFSCVLASVDKDICQLVSDTPPSTQLWDAQKEILYDEAGVLERLGIAPCEVVDWQALVGDGVDNLPGIKGIGAKTAQTLLRHFGSLEAMYARLEEVANLPMRGAKSTMQRLREGREQAFFTRQLVQLRTDVPLDFSAKEIPLRLHWTGPKQGAEAWFGRWGHTRSLVHLRQLAAHWAS